MSNILKQSIDEYRRFKANGETLDVLSRRVLNLISVTDKPSDQMLILLLTPMIEIAWIDGRVGRAEQNAILSVSDNYGLLETDANSFVILDRLMTRPSKSEIEDWWGELGEFLAFLPLGQTAAVTSLLLAQTRQIAELGQKQLFGLWRGHSAGPDERVGLKHTETRIAGITTANDERDENRATSPFNQDDCIEVLPLIKVAWADGRITRREREMIFDSLFVLGVDPSNDNLKQILEWLDLNPNEKFFQESIAKLKLGLEELSPDERANKKYSLISQCTLIAEASGGNPKTPSGGRLICQEEIDTVKHIARLLRGAATRSSV